MSFFFDIKLHFLLYAYKIDDTDYKYKTLELHSGLFSGIVAQIQILDKTVCIS